MSTAAPLSEPLSTSNVPLPTREQLPQDTITLQDMVLELLTTVHRERLDKDEMRHRIAMLLRRIYGPRTERFDPNQGSLFDETADGQDQPAPTEPAESSSTEPSSRAKRKARPHGRRKLPKDLPRRAKHHTLTEAERFCSCGCLRIDIGADRSEQLDWQPASYFVWEHWIHKYLCPRCSGRKLAASDTSATAATSTGATTATEKAASTETTVAPDVIVARAAATAGTETALTATETMITSEAPAPMEEAAAIETTPAAEVTTAAAEITEKAQTRARADAATTQETVSAATTPAAVNGAEIVPTETLRIVPGTPGPAIISAVKPAMPIPKGLPGPGLLAHLIVSKYCDHIPLYRHTNISKRQGVVLPRSTTCDWMAACADLLRPLYDLMVANVLLSRWLHTDDTTVKNLGHEPGTTDKAHLWGYWGDRDHPHNVFDFTINRQRDGPQQFLKNYRGYLHADAFSGYDGLYLPRPGEGLAAIIEVACNAHARRKFYDAKDSDVLRAHIALAYYSQLYELERGAKANHFDDAQRLQMRQELAVPILDKFHTWLKEQRLEVLPKSPINEAIGYALNQWTALCRYTEAGFLEIDNNVEEREMKHIAIGRKNWLFFGAESGGRTAAVLYSFTSTCRRLEIDPWVYLQDVLTRLPELPPDQLTELLPDRWKAARQAAAEAAQAQADTGVSVPDPE
jgi:transposase